MKNKRIKIKDKKAKKKRKEDLEKDGDDEDEEVGENEIYVRIGNIELRTYRKNLKTAQSLIGDIIQDGRIKKFLDLDKLNSDLAKLNTYFYG